MTYKKAEDKLGRLCSPPPLSCFISYHFESCGSHKPQVQFWGLRHGVKEKKQSLLLGCSTSQSFSALWNSEGSLDLAKTIVVLESTSWYCLLLKLSAGMHTVPKFTSVIAQVLWLRKLQKNWIEFPCPLRQKTSHLFTVGSPVTSRHTYWLLLLWKETSLPLPGDLLCCQDVNQSQGTLAYLLLVMTLYISQLHSLDTAPPLPQKKPKPKKPKKTTKNLVSFMVFTLWMLPVQWEAQHTKKVCQAYRKRKMLFRRSTKLNFFFFDKYIKKGGGIP